MATAELIHHHHHHHLHPRLPFHLAESRYLHSRRSAFNALPFSLTRSPATLSKRRFLTPSLRSVQCLKQEALPGDVQVEREGSSEARSQARDGGNTEAVEWVNKAAPDPMVEVDPVTVFRRIVAERRASLALARAREEANLASQTTSPSPFVKWPGKSSIAIATALALLAVAAALYFLRSRKDRKKETELTLTDGKDTLESSINGRRKLVKDTIKAPDSILTAMSLGAASLSRPKGHIGSTHDTTNGNLVESQILEGETDSNRILNAVATEDLKSDVHGSPTFEQKPHSSSIVEDCAPFKAENLGVDVMEGPWFGQSEDATEKPVPAEVEELESAKPIPEEVEEFEFEDVLVSSQGLQFSNEIVALPAAEQLASEISSGEGRLESPALISVVDGEFFGEVVTVNVVTEQVVEPSYGSVQVDHAMFEESRSDGVLADSITTSEKLEQVIEQDLIVMMEGKRAADDTICPEDNLVTGSSALDLSNVQCDETDSVTDAEETNEHRDADLSPDQVTPLEASHSKTNFEEMHMAERYSFGQEINALGAEAQGNAANLLSGGVDQTLEGIEIELNDVLDGVSVPANASQQSNGLVSASGDESLHPIDCQNIDAVASFSPPDAVTQASEEVSRQESKKALEAAVPAIAIGVGTVGALFGVAGGLQVVGFAALASVISHDIFWAQSRASLWQELNGITDRQKLLDFLAKRNIMRKEQENENL